jgi:pimeloyl-ACP methyl ester carboxylesterase
MTLASLTVGTGPRLTLLVHGFLGSGRNLSALARAWQAQDPSRTFVLPDLTGHGASPPLPASASTRDMARDVAALVPAGIRADVVGHSLGGRVALSMLENSPEKLNSVTLLDIAPGPVPPNISESARVLEALLAAPAHAPDRETMRRALASHGLAPAIVEWVLTNLRATPQGYEWRIDPHALASAAPRVNGADLWHAVEQRAVPLRAIRGGRSPYVTEADARRLESLGVTVETLPGAGHFVHVDDLPGLVALLARPA